LHFAKRFKKFSRFQDKERMFLPVKTMSHGPAVLFLLCAFLVSSVSLFAGQVPGASESKKAKRSPAAVRPTLDACSLLSKAEVENVLGEPVKETKSATQPAGGMNTSQCLFLTPTFAKSLSLSVTSPDGSHSPKTVREYWDHQFRGALDSRAETERERAPKGGGAASRKLAEGENEKPRFISGLGQQAYWVGSPIAGALYVLQNGSFVRISVGGIRQEPTRIEKSKVIATAALAKLSPRSAPKI
jgi:hypothetical protein